MSTVTDYKVIGTRPVRHDGADKVTGRALYGADYSAACLVPIGWARSTTDRSRPSTYSIE